MEYLRAQGEEFEKSGGEWRWKRHDSVTIRGGAWHRHSKGIGGDAISFLRTFQNMTFPEAVSTLLGWGSLSFPQAQPREEKPKAPFAMPIKNDTMDNVYEYLSGMRGIDQDLVLQFGQAGKLYEDARYHNAVFVGHDEEGQVRYGYKVSTVNPDELPPGKKPYRANVTSSDMKYGFSHFGTGETLYAFESPIDMLSFITFYKKNWQDHSYIELSGVGSKALHQALKTHPNIRRVGLCLDNDDPGIRAMRRIRDELVNKGYAAEDVFPVLSETKDWNMDLQIEKGILQAELEQDEEPEPRIG